MIRLSFIFLALMAAFMSPAQAHSRLVEAVPADGAVLGEAPENLRLSFSAEVELVQAAVKNSAGETVNGDFTPPEMTASDFSVALPELDEGRYTVEWTVVGSEDGHTIVGDYSFTIE